MRHAERAQGESWICSWENTLYSNTRRFFCGNPYGLGGHIDTSDLGSCVLLSAVSVRWRLFDWLRRGAGFSIHSPRVGVRPIPTLQQCCGRRSLFQSTRPTMGETGAYADTRQLLFGGSNRSSILQPSTLASRGSLSARGVRWPDSHCEIVCCSTPTISPKATCVNPAASRASFNLIYLTSHPLKSLFGILSHCKTFVNLFLRYFHSRYCAQSLNVIFSDKVINEVSV